MKKKYTNKLILALLIYSILFILPVYFGRMLGRKMAILTEKDAFEEILKVENFKTDPRNIGQYIMDFDTGTWYSIDGLNPNVPPLTIKEMSIKNIYQRIMQHETYTKNKL